ncbi:MAG: VanZ family protein [Sedimentisphaerales bacterium]|nr:VanZ family protein [Sedimentisphaerales bacterium]
MSEVIATSLPASGTILKRKRFLLGCFIFVSIVILTHIPAKSLGKLHRLFDVHPLLLHFTSYGLLATLFLSSLAAGAKLRWSLFILFGLLVIAALDEFTQVHFGRNASIYDWLSDVAGISLVFIYFQASRWNPSTNKQHSQFL